MGAESPAALNEAGATNRSKAIPVPANPRRGRAAWERMRAVPTVFRRPVPTTLQDLRTMERHVTDLTSRVSPAVVAVIVGDATGSGVVVSEDGLVLTVAHVCEEPGRNVQIVFPDGRRAGGRTLGTNHEIDSGMVRITDRGSWPHVRMGDATAVGVGDWVLAMGHPGGFDPKRSLVVRLGRVIRMSDEVVQTDCTLTGGDSGGPLFDMHGQVVGIHSRISDGTSENYHVPIGTYHATWDRLVKAENWGGQRTPSRGWVGARGVDDPDGCRIESVEQGSPAARAGVKVGDVIRRVGAQEVRDYASFRQQIAEVAQGDEVTIDLRRDGRDMSVRVTVEARRRRR